jgi:hypothetical protein
MRPIAPDGDERESGLRRFVGRGGFHFGKSLVVCGPHPGDVCNMQKESGLEATELGSVYGKWKTA